MKPAVLRLKMYSFLVGDNSEHKKSKYVNRNLNIIYNKYKDCLLNNKCMRH